MVVLLAAVLAGGYFAIWYFFKSKIVPQSVYTIHEYEPVKKNVRAPKKESADVKDKKKKRRGKK